MPDYLDEKVMETINRYKEDKHSDINDGMYINNEVVTFSRRHLFDDKISLMIPESFVDMPPQIAEMKYATKDRPQIILTNADTTVNFTFSYLNIPGKEMKDDFCPAIRNFMRITATKTNTTNKVIEEKDVDGENTQVSFFSYRANAIDMMILNVNYVASINHYALFGSFNCPYRETDQWYPVIRQVLSTIRDETKPAGEISNNG